MTKLLRRSPTVERIEPRRLLAVAPAGAEFRANSYTTSEQWNPGVAMNDGGASVVAWVSRDQDGSGLGVYAQRYDAAGVAQGAEFRVNSNTTDDQGELSVSPGVAMDADGNFVVVWSSWSLSVVARDVYARRYASDGAARGEEFLVNTHTTNNQRSPVVAMQADGDFVVTWQSSGQDGSGYGVYAQ